MCNADLASKTAAVMNPYSGRRLSSQPGHSASRNGLPITISAVPALSRSGRPLALRRRYHHLTKSRGLINVKSLPSLLAARLP